MTEYIYHAVNREGRKRQGVIQATAEKDLYDSLVERGYHLVESRKAKKGSVFSRSWFSQKVTSEDLEEFCIYFAEMSRVGISVLEILKVLEGMIPSARLRDIFHNARIAIKGGSLLSEAFEEYGDVFDPIFLSLLRAGEKTGSLVKVFDHLASYYKGQSKMRARVVEAITYPALVFVMVGGLLIFLMTSVVPELGAFFQMTGEALPLSTRLLIQVSECIKGAAIGIGIFFVALTLGGWILYGQSQTVRETLGRWILGAPLLGEILLQIACARFIFIFQMLLVSGLGLLEALFLARGAIKNHYLLRKLKEVESMICEGSELSDALSRMGVFPHLMLKMIEVGEKTGSLERTLGHAREFYERETEKKTQRLLTLLQPVLLGLVGAMILWIAVSVFMPLYDHLTVLDI